MAAKRLSIKRLITLLCRQPFYTPVVPADQLRTGSQLGVLGMQHGVQEDENSQLKHLLEQTLKPRGNDPVTAQSDLWAHAGIRPGLRDAALTLQGSDVFKKVKPPGDTTLYKNQAWTLESIALAGARPAAQQTPQFSTAQLAAAFALPPGHHVLPEEAKGPMVQPSR